jgi:hypothetical protein
MTVRPPVSEHPEATQRHNLVSSPCLLEAGLEGVVLEAVL